MGALEVIDVEEVAQAQQAGSSLVKANYTTAMQVIKPRNLTIVQDRVLQEAAIAGEEFYYSWAQRDNKTGRSSTIEGLTIGAAMAIARNLGNCAIPVEVEETKEAYIFRATFIDLETGFNLHRVFRQRRGQNIGEKMKGDGRAEDIIFQIGQSKAIRNVVLGAVPNWLQKKVLAKAKENVSGIIEKMGKEKARDMLTKKASALGIELERIEAAFGKIAGWDTEKLVMISGAIRGVEDGLTSIDEAFPDNKKDPLNEKLTQKPVEQPKPEPTPAHNPQTGEVAQSEAPAQNYQALSGKFVGEMHNRKVSRSDAARMAGKYNADELAQLLADPGALDAVAESMSAQAPHAAQAEFEV